MGNTTAAIAERPDSSPVEKPFYKIILLGEAQ